MRNLSRRFPSLIAVLALLAFPGCLSASADSDVSESRANVGFASGILDAAPIANAGSAAFQQGSTFAENPEDAVGMVILYDEYGMEISRGSAFAISDSGLVATNFHCVIGNGGNSAKVSFKGSSGAVKEYRVASVYNYSQTLDLAILRIDASNIPTLKLGNSDSLKAGQTIKLIGTPLGLEDFRESITAGNITSIISRYGSKEVLCNITAFSGNSGGPIINGAQEAVGITSAKYDDSTGFVSGIPINYLKPLLAYDLSLSVRMANDNAVYGVLETGKPGFAFGRISEGSISETAPAFLYSEPYSYTLYDAPAGIYIAKQAESESIFNFNYWKASEMDSDSLDESEAVSSGDDYISQDSFWGLIHEYDGNIYTYGEFSGYSYDSKPYARFSTGDSISYASEGSAKIIEHARYEMENHLKSGYAIEVKSDPLTISLLSYSEGKLKGESAVFSQNDGKIVFSTYQGGVLEGPRAEMAVAGTVRELTYRKGVPSGDWASVNLASSKKFSIQKNAFGDVTLENKLMKYTVSIYHDGMIELKSLDYELKADKYGTVEILNSSGDSFGAKLASAMGGTCGDFVYLYDANQNRISARINEKSREMYLGELASDSCYDGFNGKAGAVLDYSDLYAGQMKSNKVTGKGAYFKKSDMSLYVGALDSKAPKGRGILFEQYFPHVRYGIWDGYVQTQFFEKEFEEAW
ncbi:MAG: serine protease [Clostridiales bacterium]|jgi:S1-C subfamily serine protease|nr:serine protease [Clostridiales bacterium]